MSSGYARESAEGFDHGVSVEHGRKSEEMAHHEAQHSENRQQVGSSGGLLEHGMERLGERVRRESHNISDIKRMALTIAG